MRRVEPAELLVRPFHLLDQEYALLVGGERKPNPMTVSWGGLGTLWGKPVATLYVRPTRHTCFLLNEHAELTLNVMPASLAEVHEVCGSQSGRDIDKWAATGLQPLASAEVEVPRVAGADLSLECRVLATLDFQPARFLDRSIEDLYPRHDYHRLFFGHVVAAWATDRFLAA